MSLFHSEKLIQAARLAYEGTSFDIADLLCREAVRMAEKSAGSCGTPELMRRMSALLAASAHLRENLAVLRRAGFKVAERVES